MLTHALCMYIYSHENRGFSSLERYRSHRCISIRHNVSRMVMFFLCFKAHSFFGFVLMNVLNETKVNKFQVEFREINILVAIVLQGSSVSLS